MRAASFRPPRPARPLVVAHRGDSAHQPENTLAAFDAALAAGADGLELDLRLTADGTVVVVHDRTLARVFGRVGRVDTVHHADLSAWDAGAHFAPDTPFAAVPTLGQVLDRYHGHTHLFLEIKGRAARRHDRRLLGAVIAALPPPGAARRLWLIGFSYGLMRRAKRRRPDLPVAWTHASALVGWSGGPTRWLGPLDGLVTPAGRVDATLGDRLHRDGRWLLCYGCDQGGEVRAALAADADVLMADDPGLLRRRVAGWVEDAP